MTSPTSPMRSPAEALPGPLRAFLATEVGSTMVLLAATVVALVWANSPLRGAYEAVWGTQLAIRLGGVELGLDLRHWVNDGLMALFFFVVGLELSREVTRGRLSDRRLVGVPALAALGGMAVPALVYLAFNAGGPGQAGWAIPIATDTAFALGLLAIVGPRCPDPLRAFLLSAVVVDDLVAILVIAAAYSGEIHAYALLAAVGAFGLVVVLRRLRLRRGPAVAAVLGIVIWLATLYSGLHPTVVGIAMGLLAPAYAPAEMKVLRARELVGDFARDPTPESARMASLWVQGTISPNERLQLLLHPWTSYVILPVFALANAGVPLDPDTLARAVTSPVAWGVVAGLAGGKLAGICLGSWVGLRTRLGVLPGNLVWGQVAGGAAVAGIGFTLSLFIADLAFTSETVIAEAKVGILFGSLLAATLGWVVFRLAWNRGAVCAPPPGPGEPADEEQPDTLADPVTDQDHIRGPEDAPVTLVEYGDYECPYCGHAHPVVHALLERFGDNVRFVFRHYPLPSVHPHARAAALAAEAAATHGRFWQMHDQLFTHQLQLDEPDLVAHAELVGVPGQDAVGAPAQAYAARVDADVASGRRSGVRGTPTFFINGHRYHGNHDVESFAAAIEQARSEPKNQT